jgi:hypothetical protein
MIPVTIEAESKPVKVVVTVPVLRTLSVAPALRVMVPVAGAARAAPMAAYVAAFVRRGDTVELAWAALQDLAAGFRWKLAVVLFVAVQPLGVVGLSGLPQGCSLRFQISTTTSLTSSV